MSARWCSTPCSRSSCAGRPSRTRGWPRRGTEAFAEALSYFPAAAEDEPGPRRYLSLLERAAAAVDIPVIGSLNGVTPGGWTSYARAMQDAGAAAIELNIYYIPGDPHISGREVEQRHIDILGRVKDAVTVPVAVKLSPYFSSPGEMALRLDEAGADGLVLFNRFLQPDIDPETLAVVPDVYLSSPAEARLPRTWIAILRRHMRASLAATTGVEGPADVAKYLLAGADVVMTASALIRHGPGHAAVLLDGLSGWMARKGYPSVAECAECSPCPRVLTSLLTSARAMSARCRPPTAPAARGDARSPKEGLRGQARSTVYRHRGLTPSGGVRIDLRSRAACRSREKP